MKEAIFTTESYALGIDIGGSHISACRVDIASSRLIDRSFVRTAVNPHGSAAEIIDTWAGAIESAFERLPRRDWRIGIAMPGPFDYDKGISQITGLDKFESLYGLPVRQWLAERLDIPEDSIRMMNDASAFLLGEVMAGAGKGYSRVAGITLGTGLGSARFFGNRILDGDLWCTPFRDSRAEDYLCSRWFLKEYASLPGALPVRGVKDLVPLSTTDPAVRSLFETFGFHLAEILLMKYPPDVREIVIVGGNITRAWDLFIPAALEFCRNLGTEMNIRPALLGEQAAVIGAAFLWRE